MTTHTIDIVDKRYIVKFNKSKDRYFYYDTLQGTEHDLRVLFNSKRNTKYIRFSYRKNGKRCSYQKTIQKIKWELFGEWTGGNKTLVGLTDEDCKKIIKKEYDELEYLTPFSQMRYSKNPLIKKVHLYIERNGGLKTFLNFTTELGINNDIYYQDHKGVILKSSFEFKFFSILHFNKIKYEYEPFKVEKFVPDFYIPDKNYLIEILGLNSNEKYFKKSQQKEITYNEKGFKYFPIEVDSHNQTQTIIERSQQIFGKIKIPDFIQYFKKFTLNGDQFIEKLKEYLKLINDGKLKIDDDKNGDGFVQKNRTYYDYVLDNYGSVFSSIKSLVGYPSVIIQRPKGYWFNSKNCEYELEEIFKKEKYIPNVHQSQTTFSGIYILRQFYSHRGVDSINNGGEFYDFIKKMKLKYGYRDIENEKKESRDNQVYNVVMMYYRQEIPLTGEGSLDKNYGWVYDYLREKKGGVFQYIKDEIGYPPPHVWRPKGYYENPKNVEYELEQNWKKYKRLLKFSEVKGKKGKDNTLNSLYSQVGIDQFKKGGRFYSFIEYLKNTYGYVDVESQLQEEFNKKVKIYLNGLNDGKWNSTTHSSKELGLLQRYSKYVVKTYGSLFQGIKSEIGYPHPRVGRYRGYYNNIDNCKYEIENTIKRFKCLPLYSQVKKPPFKGNNTILRIYDIYKTKEFNQGGVFFEFVQECLKKYSKVT